MPEYIGVFRLMLVWVIFSHVGRDESCASPAAVVGLSLNPEERKYGSWSNRTAGTLSPSARTTLNYFPTFSDGNLQAGSGLVGKPEGRRPSTTQPNVRHKKKVRTEDPKYCS